MASLYNPDENDVSSRITFTRDQWISIAVILLFCATQIASLFVPAWVDDIIYLIEGSRAGYDGWQKIHPYPQCGPGFIADTPLTWLPGRALAWVVQFAINSIFTLRLVAIAIWLAGIAYVAWFLKQCIIPAQPLLSILAGIISFAGLGILPMTMVTSRPEGAMFLAIGLYTSLPLWIEKYPKLSQWGVLAITLCFLLLSSWFFSIHPKALFYLPLVLLSTGYTCKWNKASGVLLSIFSAIASYQVIVFWQFRNACLNSPGVRKLMFESRFLDPSQFLHNPLAFLHGFFQNLFNGIYYVRDAIFPVETWTIPHPAHSTLISFFMECITSLFIISVVWCSLSWIARGTLLMIRQARDTHSLGQPTLPLALCLLAAALLQWGVQLDKKVFNFSLIWVTLLLSGVMVGAYLLKYTTYWNNKKEWVVRMYQRLCKISILSQYVLLVVCIPTTLSTLRHTSPDGDFAMADEWYLISPLHYEQTQANIVNAAKACHIAPDKSSSRVGVDIVTYLPFKATYQPLRLVFKFHDFDDPNTFFSFLRGQQSSGVVTLCKSLPSSIRGLAKETGGVCCIPREEINAQQP